MAKLLGSPLAGLAICYLPKDLVIWKRIESLVLSFGTSVQHLMNQSYELIGLRSSIGHLKDRLSVYGGFSHTDTSANRRIENRFAQMAKDYWIFNADQVDGYKKSEEQPVSRAERIEKAEDFFQAVGVSPRPGGNRAYYCPDSDAVHMPAFDAFKEPLFYYSVLSHETTHWTGAAHRLNRDLSGRFHTDSYAMEELVAELGAAFLCSELGLPTDPRQDHAPYIASWLKVLKNDKRAIFTAAAKAQEAVDWMIEELKSALACRKFLNEFTLKHCT